MRDSRDASGLKHRLHVDAPLAPRDRVTLEPERAHYIVRVLRLRPGDGLLLFNGDGGGRHATLINADTKRCDIEIGDIVVSEPPPEFSLCLAQALIKGDKLDFVLQKATELGVTDIALIATDRTEVVVRDARIERRTEHWSKVIVAAAEQCGRLRLPVLHAPATLADLLATVRPVPPAPAQCFLLDPGAPPLTGPAPAVDTTILVGPEGGFSDTERDGIIGSGFSAIGLGRVILRADTAPVAALAILRNGWGWRLP